MTGKTPQTSGSVWMPLTSVILKNISIRCHRFRRQRLLPLVSKLKENGKRVIGLGMKESSSNLLVDNCDEFIYYEDLERPLGIPPKSNRTSLKRRKRLFNF